jgi:hypothetical protein
MYTKDIENALNDAILELYKAQSKLINAYILGWFILVFLMILKPDFQLSLNSIEMMML